MNKTFIDNAKDLDIVMPMYNVLEYRDNYYMTFVELLKSWNKWWLERNWWEQKNNNKTIKSKSFKYKTKIIGRTPDDNNTLDQEKLFIKIFEQFFEISGFAIE